MTTTIKISDSLAAQIDEFVGYYGFKTRSDFVRKAILKQVEELTENVWTIKNE